MSDLEKFENIHTDTSEKYKELAKLTGFYRNLHSRLLMENTQLKNKVDVLRQENKKLQEYGALVQQNLGDIQLLCNDQQEETSNLQPQQLQERERMEDLLKQRELVMQKKDLAGKLQPHLNVSPLRFRRLHQVLQNAIAQKENLLQEALLRQVPPDETHPAATTEFL